MEMDVISTDVLVVGGGVAGCRAAIEAANHGVKTMLVTKGQVARSGCSAHSPGTVSAVGPWSDPRDSWERYMADAIKGGEYMADQELARVLFSEMGDRFVEMEKYGLYWRKNDDGTLDAYKLGGHSYPRSFSSNKPCTAKNIMQALRGELVRLHVPIKEDTMVTSLLTEGEKVVGATALDYLNTSFKVFRAKSVILCTGHCDQIFPWATVSKECTAESQAMAYQAGAEMIDLENHLFQGAKLSYYPYMYMPIHSCRERQRRHDAGYSRRLLNADGKDFFAEYRAVAPPGIAPKTLILIAQVREIEEGRGTENDGVYSDLSLIPNLDEVLKQSKSKIIFENMGIDPSKEPFETGFASHANTGGIRVNVRSESTVPGLYAAGGTAAPYYGFMRLTGFGLGQGLVFGKRAGEYAAIRAAGIEMQEIDWNQVEEEQDHIHALLKRAGEEGSSPAAVKRMIQLNNWEHFGPIKDESGLKKGLKEINRINEEIIPKMVLKTATRRYNYGLVEAIEVLNMLLLSEIKMRAALMRKETRGPFVRRDYLQRNDKDWLKHIVVKRVKGEAKFWTEPVEFPYVKPE